MSNPTFKPGDVVWHVRYGKVTTDDDDGSYEYPEGQVFIQKLGWFYSDGKHSKDDVGRVLYTLDEARQYGWLSGEGSSRHGHEGAGRTEESPKKRLALVGNMCLDLRAAIEPHLRAIEQLHAKVVKPEPRVATECTRPAGAVEFETRVWDGGPEYGANIEAPSKLAPFLGKRVKVRVEEILE